MKKATQITICGDICPTKDTINLFETADEKTLFNDVLDDFKKADLVIGNLEFVLSDNPIPIHKAGPILVAKTKCVNILKSANFNLLSLANNHIKDCGEEGVMSTIVSCQGVNIETFGAANNLKNAKKPIIKSINGIKIGIIAFAEQEFNVATNTTAGANYFDPLEDLDLISEIKSQVDYLIVIYHGGVEYYEYPSPLLKKKCRKFVDKGADLVTCQHSHCIGTIDNYKDKKIIYGQGNTVFGFRKNDPSWNQGLLLNLVWQASSTTPIVSYLPITATSTGIRKIEEYQAQKLLISIQEKSKNIEDDDFLEKEWIQFCEQKRGLYFPFLFGYNRLFIHLNRMTNNGLIRLFYSKSKLKTSHNVIRCEAHNEVMQTLLKNQAK